MGGYVFHISVNNYSIRVVSRANYFQKQVGAKKWKRPNRGIKLSKSQNHFSLSFQQLQWGLLGTKNVSSQASAKSFKGKQITAAGKMWLKSHCVYSHKIMQTSSLGRQQKNLMEHNDCLYVVSILQWRIRKTPTDNIIIPQNQFQTNCQIITPMLIKSIGTTLGQYVFLNVILLIWDIILYTGLTEFHMFFLTQLNCLHNFQVDILSNKEAIRCTLKELRLKQACYYAENVLLQIFF